MKPLLKKILPLSFLILLLNGCHEAVLFHSKGEIGLQEKSLIVWATILMLIVVIPVIVMTIVFAYKYRASNEKATYAPEWSHSAKLEFWVWLVPCLIILVLSIISWRTTHSLDPYRPIPSQAKPITIKVISLDWKWLFIYPEEGIATINHIEFPVDVPVHFEMTSGDTAMNSFFIPQLGGQIYTMGGMQTQLHLIANHKGVYDGISANFSGDGFAGMKFTAKATTQAEFEKWVNTVRHSPKVLNASEYLQLTKPTENNPIQYYGKVQTHLYEKIMMSFMMPMPLQDTDKKSMPSMP